MIRPIRKRLRDKKPIVVPVAPAKPEPSWLFHCHVGDKKHPVALYDNQDGTYTMLVDHVRHANLKAEQALLIFAPVINMLVQRGEKFWP